MTEHIESSVLKWRWPDLREGDIVLALPAMAFGSSRFRRLLQPHAWPSTILVDEFDAGRLQGSPHRQVIGNRHRRFGSCSKIDSPSPHRFVEAVAAVRFVDVGASETPSVSFEAEAAVEHQVAGAFAATARLACIHAGGVSGRQSKTSRYRLSSLKGQEFVSAELLAAHHS
ncbi:MAG: hypothetical protein ACLQNV_00220 [Steroidobacteraceae bacterium]